MSTTENILPFPQNLDEEQTRKIRAEATRLAAQPELERTHWMNRHADDYVECYGITLAEMQSYVKIIVGEKARKEHEAKAEQQRIEKRSEKQQQDEERKREREQQQIVKDAERKAKDKRSTLAAIVKLPSALHQAKLAELAKRIVQDLATLGDELAELIDAEREALPPGPAEWSVEPAADPVPTVLVLQQLIDKISKHIAARPDEVLTIALWVMLTWVHEVAANYSPYLTLTSSGPDSGKTTTLSLVKFLTPKACLCADLTGPSLFRFVHHEKPTMLVDDVDDLFIRRPDLNDIFKTAWTRGPKIPRTQKVGDSSVTVWFDPFCPKAVTLIGERLPEALRTRCILIKMWPKTATDKLEAFALIDDDECIALRSKLARWATDNAAGLKAAQPLLPAGFSNRLANNWRLLFAIAELADWGQRARDAGEQLTRERAEPSWQRLFLQVAAQLFSDGRKYILSSTFPEELTRDPLSPWNDYPGFRRQGKPTERQVAILAKSLDVLPTLCGPKRLRGYMEAAFAKPFAHFQVQAEKRVREDRTRGKAKPKATRQRRSKGRSSVRRGRGGR